MRSAIRQQSCDCFEEHGHQEFKKIVDLEDAGVTVYQYIPQTRDEIQKAAVNGEVFIFRNSGDDLKIEEYTGDPGKKSISCPRCTKMIERAKKLFKNLPPAKIREVTGVCNHCYKKHVDHCKCCDKIVDKFLKFCLEQQNKSDEYREAHKSWARQTQLSFKKSLSNIRDDKKRYESQEPVSRYIPTTKPARDTFPTEIYEKHRFKSKSELIHDQDLYKPADDFGKEPLKVISFLDFSEEQKLAMEEKNELIRKKKKQVADEKVDQPLRSMSLIIDFIDSKPQSTAEKDMQSTTRRDIKPKPKVEENVKFTTVIEPTSIKEKDVKPKPILEKDSKPKSIMKRKGLIKDRETGVSRDDTKLGGIRKRTGSSTSRHSFETIMRCMSEPNVSVFSYAFPSDKPIPKKEIKTRVSSSELIKNTQDMLAEREETAKKIKEELEDMRRKRDEEKKIWLAEKKMRLEEEKRKQEKEKRKREEEKEKQRDEKRKREEERAGIDEESDKTGRSKNYIDATQTADTKEGFAKRKKKGTEGDIDATRTADTKEVFAKRDRKEAEEEKRWKQKEKHDAIGEKKVKADTKSDTTVGLQKDKRIEKTTDGRKEAIDTNNLLQDGDKKQKDDQEKAKDRDKNGKQHDVGAQSALKELVAKQSKEKSEEEKLKKQQEKDAALIAKKAQEAEKALETTQKQLPAETKAKRKSITDAKPSDKTDGDKGDTQKGKNVDDTGKEDKAKGGKTDDMAALLRDQLMKQKQQELEKERIRKEQQKEKELAEKRLKELEAKKEAEKAAIKPPVLKTEHEEDSINENITQAILKPDEVTDVIIGQKIFKVKCAKKNEDKAAILDSTQTQKGKPHTEQTTSKQEPELNKVSEPFPKPQQAFSIQKPGEPTPMQAQQRPTTATGDKKTKTPDPGDAKGVIRYTLSDRTFIDKGWTMLPTEKVVRKMNVYRMRPSKPEFDWFEHNKNKREMTYDSGEKLAEFDDNGRGRWYYRSGELALDYYDAEETNAGQRFVVYSTGLPDERGRSRPRTLLATFDYSGNGIVFDHTGKIRLKYNQTEGVVLDRTIGPVSHWKWHTLNDPPVLQQVMIDTQMPYKDPTILQMGASQADAKRPDNEEMLAIEFENFLKEKRQKLTQSFKPFQIKMKAMKINEYFSLRVLDQASIHLLFRDGTTNLKLNIGMILDHKEIVDTDTAEICEVSNTLDKLPACTDSIAGLQKAVAKAQAQERLRVRHEHRLKPPQPTASIDALRAGCSRPLRTPVVQASISSCDKMTPKRFKPSGCNLYYNTQLF